MIELKKVLGISLFALIVALLAFSMGGSPGISGTNGSNGSNSVSGGITYYLHNTSSDLPNSKIMNTSVGINLPKSYLNFTSLPNGNTNLINWSSPQVGFTLIPSGVHILHIHALKIFKGGAHAVKLYFQTIKTNSTGGNASVISTSELSIEVQTIETYIDIPLIYIDEDYNLTDRIILSLYANSVGSGALPDMQIIFDDLTDARFTIPSNAFTSQDIIEILQPDLNLKVNKSGDIMSGQLTAPSIHNDSTLSISAGLFSEKNIVLDYTNNRIRMVSGVLFGDINTIDIYPSSTNFSQKINMSQNNISNVNIISVSGITMSSIPDNVYRSSQTINNGLRPYVLNLTISNASGVNTNTTLYCNGHCNSTFSNIKFMIGTTQLPYCMPLKSTGKTFINLTINGTLDFYYGYNTSQGAENCPATAYQYQGNSTTDYLFPLALPQYNYAYESVYRVLTMPQDIAFGVADTATFTGDDIVFDDYATGGFLRLYTCKNGVCGYTNDGLNLSTNNDYTTKITFDNSIVKYYINNAYKGSNSGNLSDSKQGIYFDINGGTANMKYALAIPYTNVSEPYFNVWGTETIVPSSVLYCVRIDSTGSLYTLSGYCV